MINVSSGAGQLAEGLQDWAPAYSMSKTALNALTQHFAGRLPAVRRQFRLARLGAHRRWAATPRRFPSSKARIPSSGWRSTLRRS